MKTLKTNLRLLALLLILGIAQTTAHAQCPGVWVPDANFRNFLKTTYPQVMNAQDSLLPCQAATVTGQMNCSNKNITDLTGITHFNSLSELHCSSNQLTSLPALPTSLTTFNCGGNQLTVLPSLPSALTTIYCNLNQLTSLPTLPTALITLTCSNNPLSSLPALPAALKILTCSNNQLTALPTLPTSLTYLRCDINQLTDLPILPNTLATLYCSNNQLTALPVLPPTLTSLNSSDNHLTALPTLPRALEYLTCDNNQLTSLPVLPTDLSGIWCRNNQISCLPLLPNSLGSLFATGNLFTCLPNVPTNPQFTSNIGTTICTTACALGRNFITGKVYVDQNADNLHDINEPTVDRVVVQASEDLFCVTDRFGNYALYLDSGIYNLNIHVPNHFSLGTPTTPYSFNFASQESINRDKDYGLRPANMPALDVAATITSTAPPRPGFTFCYNIAVRNVGNLPATGTLHFYPDSRLNYTGQTQFPFANLPLFRSWDTTVCMTVPVSIPLGTRIVSNVHAITTVIDIDTTNNRDRNVEVVVGSCDPNDKQVTPESLTPADVTNGQRLTYTIRFQNVGTAEAIFVIIEDTLDAAHLDISSLEVLAASHDYEMSLSGPGYLKFHFHSIMLPDSTTDEPGSHGFVKYSIRPKSTLALGDQISNTAHIYFDFNPAVITNTVLTPVALPASILDGQLGTLSLQPNPASTSVTLRADALAGQAVNLSVLDLTGRAVYQASEAVFTGQTALDLSDLPAGCYIVQLQAQGGQLSQKLVVVR